jgi:hypothetical protein
VTNGSDFLNPGEHVPRGSSAPQTMPVSGRRGDGDDPASDNGTFRQEAFYPGYAP